MLKQTQPQTWTTSDLQNIGQGFMDFLYFHYRLLVFFFWNCSVKDITYLYPLDNDVPTTNRALLPRVNPKIKQAQTMLSYSSSKAVVNQFVCIKQHFSLEKTSFHIEKSILFWGYAQLEKVKCHRRIMHEPIKFSTYS